MNNKWIYLPILRNKLIHHDFGIDLNIKSWLSQYQSINFNLLLGAYHTPIDSTFRIGSDSTTISDGVNSFYTGLKFNYRYLSMQKHKNID